MLVASTALHAGCGASSELIGDDHAVDNSTATAFSRYDTGDSPLAFIDACAQADHTMVLPNQDDQTAPLALPFSFLFYRTRTSSVWISSNGVLGFATPNNAFSASCLPDAAAPLDAVFVLWSDLFTRTGVCVATVGTAPTRRFVATWNDARLCCSDDATVHLTFSVVLEEGSDAIDVQYSRLDGLMRATVGVQNETGRTATQFGCATSGRVVSAGQSVRFTPVI